MHPMFEEFCRAQPQTVRPEVFRRWQRTIRDEISQKLEEREQLLAENAELKAKLERLTADKRAAKTPTKGAVSP